MASTPAPATKAPLSHRWRVLALLTLTSALAGTGRVAEWRLVRSPYQCHPSTMEHIFIALLSMGALLGFAMGWGRLSGKIGCALLCAVPVLMFALIRIEPMVTGERQSSTAGLAIPFGTLWVGLAAAAGVVIGVIVRLIAKR